MSGPGHCSRCYSRDLRYISELDAWQCHECSEVWDSDGYLLGTGIEDAMTQAKKRMEWMGLR